MQIKPAKRLWSSQVRLLESFSAIVTTFCFTAFNEMDENHDGKVSQSEFVEVTELSSAGSIKGLLQACMAQKKFSTMLTLKIIDVFITEEQHGGSERSK